MTTVSSLMGHVIVGTWYDRLVIGLCVFGSDVENGGVGAA